MQYQYGTNRIQIHYKIQKYKNAIEIQYKCNRSTMFIEYKDNANTNATRIEHKYSTIQYKYHSKYYTNTHQLNYKWNPRKPLKILYKCNKQIRRQYEYIANTAKIK